MKKHRVVAFAIIFLAMASAGCAQAVKKTADPEPLLPAGIPQPLWTYDTGG